MKSYFLFLTLIFGLFAGSVNASEPDTGTANFSSLPPELRFLVLEFLVPTQQEIDHEKSISVINELDVGNLIGLMQVVLEMQKDGYKSQYLPEKLNLLAGAFCEKIRKKNTSEIQEIISKIEKEFSKDVLDNLIKPHLSARFSDVLLPLTCRVLKGHTRPVRGVFMVSDTQIASCSDDNTVRVWDLALLNSLTLKQLVFCINMQEKYSRTKLPTTLNPDECKIFYSLAQMVQKRMLELKWIAIPGFVSRHPLGTSALVVGGGGVISVGVVYFLNRWLWKK